MTSIDDFLNTLNSEEREKHKALIEECRDREKKVRIDTEQSKKTLAEYTKSLKKIKIHMLNSEGNVSRLEGNLSNLDRNGSEAKTSLDKNLEQISDLNLKIDLIKFNIECEMKEDGLE